MRSNKMEYLHNEILENILFRLPIEPALHAKRVRKDWRDILRSKTEKQGIFFAFSHHVDRWDIITHDETRRKEFFYEDEYDHYDPAKINHYYSNNTLSKIEHGKYYVNKSSPTNIMVGSCNGLVCFSRYNRLTLCRVPCLICNPLTGEAVCLPEYNYSDLPQDLSTTRPRYIDGHLAGGFGYCPLTNHYKVVTIYYHPLENRGHVQVYTVGGELRYIGYIDRYSGRSIDDCSCINANGSLYWLHRNSEVQESEIIAFDLVGENADYIPLPRSEDFEYQTSISSSPLQLLGGNNNLYLVHKNCSASSYDIWVYKRNPVYGSTNHSMKECSQKENQHGKCWSPWDKEFIIRCEVSYFTPFAITRNNQVLLWFKHRSPYKLRLYCYEPKNSTLNELWDDKAKGMNCSYIEAIPHRQSIVSLKDLGETNITSLKDFIS